MAYSGKYIPKNLNKYRGDPSAIRYRSLWERQCFVWCDSHPDIKSWSSEEIVVPYYWDIDKRYHRYYVDLKITFKNGTTLLVEVKPDKETKPPKNPNKSKRYIGEAMTYVKNINKWEAANTYAKDRGWEFVIWTENDLKRMGIMKEEKKSKLKPLKPMKPFRKKSKK